MPPKRILSRHPPSDSPPPKQAKPLKSSNKPASFRPITSLFGPSPVSKVTTNVITSNTRKRKARQGEADDISSDGDVEFVSVVESKGKSNVREQLTEEMTDHSQIWADRFSPQNREQLAIHPKKAQQVESWLKDALDGTPVIRKYRRLLVLSGPAGSCKTETIKVVAQSLGANILQYRNLHNLEFASTNRDALSGDFESWLHRATGANVLSFSSRAPSTSTSSPPQKTLLLIEDLPPLFTNSQLRSFRRAIKSHIESPYKVAPVVLIVSNTSAKPTEDVHENHRSVVMDGTINAWRVVGDEILNLPGTAEIKFNSVAKRIMKKALNQIFDDERFKSVVGKWKVKNMELEAVLQRSGGDMRAAINILQFFVWEGGRLPDVVIKREKKVKSEGVKLSYGSADDSLFLFHAIGKVLYNKRWDQRADMDKKDLQRISIKQKIKTDKLPRHLRNQWTRNVTKVDPEKVLDEGSVDPDVFITYLHENFPPFTNDIEEVSNILEYLSWCMTPIPATYSRSVSIRSLLMCLPSPPPYRNQKFHKAAFWEESRKQSENWLRIEETLKQGKEKPQWWRMDCVEKLDIVDFMGRMNLGGPEIKSLTTFTKMVRKTDMLIEDDVGIVEVTLDRTKEEEELGSNADVTDGYEEDWFVKEDDIVD